MNRIARGFIILSAIAAVTAACAVTPRVSRWDSPKRFTKAQVFNAALQAGTELGLQATSSDRDAGTISFAKRVGKGQMNVNVNVAERPEATQVRTTANYGGGLAIAGLHEEFIRNFHVLLFRNLGITEPSERNVDVQQLR